MIAALPPRPKYWILIQDAGTSRMKQDGKKRPRAVVPLASTAEDGGGSRSVRRAIEIFEFLLQLGGPTTIGEIVSALQIPKSTAYELVRTLSDSGYLEPSRRGGMFLGRKLFELGMAYRAQVDLLRDGSQIVEELSDGCGETVQLSVLENDMMLVLLKEEGSHPIRIISRVGSRVPVNWAASGRLLVSDMDDGALTSLLTKSVRQSPTGRALTDIPKFIQQVRKFRKQGYATETNETNEHAGCVAAPVIDGSGKCIAAISIVAPEHRLKQNREALTKQVRDAAAMLSQRLGGR